MKRMILAVALGIFATPTVALDAGPHRTLGPDMKGRISDFPPKIAGNTNAQSAIQKMNQAGWVTRSTQCMGERGRVCEVNFVNPCGVLAHATFLGQKLSGPIEVGGLIKNVNYRIGPHGSRSIRRLPSPPCPDEATDE